MLDTTLKNAIVSEAAAIPAEPVDPLMRQLLFPEDVVDLAYISLFRSMAYYLKYKVQDAKNNDIKKFGIYVKSLDNFVFGAYISVVDNDGEDSVTLDYTFNEEDFKDMIENEKCITIDDPSFAPYLKTSTNHMEKSDGSINSFYIVDDYAHTVYYIAAECLKNHIYNLLDASTNPDDCTVTLEGVFTATGFIDDNGEKKIGIVPDETIKQIIKSDDVNEVA